eukprot:363361-Chlamydomonas_euryale.AAC.11
MPRRIASSRAWAAAQSAYGIGCRQLGGDAVTLKNSPAETACARTQRRDPAAGAARDDTALLEAIETAMATIQFRGGLLGRGKVARGCCGATAGCIVKPIVMCEQTMSTLLFAWRAAERPASVGKVPRPGRCFN